MGLLVPGSIGQEQEHFDGVYSMASPQGMSSHTAMSLLSVVAKLNLLLIS